MQIYRKRRKEKYEHRRFELKVAMNIKIKIYVLRSVLRTIRIVQIDRRHDAESQRGGQRDSESEKFCIKLAD